MRRFTSTILILIGLICYGLTVFSIVERTDPRRISFDNKKVEAQYTAKKFTNFPVKISIPDQQIELPILPAQIKDGQWEATTEGVSYLISSPIPGEKGNSILYGHNWANLLGKMVNSRPGQEMIVEYKDGTKKTFEIEYTVTVTPDQTHILEQSSDKRITIYTCTGFLDSKRFVAVALLKEDSKQVQQENNTQQQETLVLK